MARGQKGGGRQQPVRGFRPGKEPPRLRTQRAKEQLGDGNWAQKKLIDALAGRTPAEARRMMGRWRAGALAVAVLLAAVALLLMITVSLVGGFAVSALAALAFAMWWRLRQQKANLETLVDMLNGRRGS
jgi:hypothetical protein